MPRTDRNPIDAALATFLESPGDDYRWKLRRWPAAAGCPGGRRCRRSCHRSHRPHCLGLAMAADHRQRRAQWASRRHLRAARRLCLLPVERSCRDHSRFRRSPAARAALHRGDDRDVRGARSRSGGRGALARRPGAAGLAPLGRDDFRADAGREGRQYPRAVSMTIRLRDLHACFEGVIPSIIATAAQDGVPNISYLSHVALVDDEHVALSDQFFSKTAANIRANNNATVLLVDPRDGSQYRLSVVFERSLDSGALFEIMAAELPRPARSTRSSMRCWMDCATASAAATRCCS